MKNTQLNVLTPLLLRGKGKWVLGQATSSLCHKRKATEGFQIRSNMMLLKRLLWLLVEMAYEGERVKAREVRACCGGSGGR